MLSIRKHGVFLAGALGLELGCLNYFMWQKVRFSPFIRNNGTFLFQFVHIFFILSIPVREKIRENSHSRCIVPLAYFADNWCCFVQRFSICCKPKTNHPIGMVRFLFLHDALLTGGADDVAKPVGIVLYSVNRFIGEYQDFEPQVTD